MILNTTNQGQNGYTLADLYPHIDPKYFYPGNQQMSGRYHWDNQSTDYPNKTSGFELEDLMSQRQEITDSKIQMLASDICQRYRLRDENLYRINLDQCECRNLIFEIGDGVWDKKRMELENKIIDLEKEKRMEQTSYFRDILFLKKELRESLIEKLEDRQKTDLFQNQAEVLA